MTAEAFIQSFKQFTARRGCPIKMISDNAKTFKSAAKTIQRVMGSCEIQQYLTGLGQNGYSIWREHLGGVAYSNIWSSALNVA